MTQDKVVYLHIRNDTNKPFYVGIGSINRAYSKNGRSQWWKRIYNVASRTVYILYSGLTSQEAKQIEIETIKKLKENGFELCNLTDGGDGRLGSKQPQSFIDNQRTFMMGNSFGLAKPVKEPIIAVNLKDNSTIKFVGRKAIENYGLFKPRQVYRCANRDNICISYAKGIYKGFQFFWESDYLRKVGIQNYSSI